MYPNTSGTTIVRKRISFLAALVLSLAAIIVTTVLSASGIAVYALSVVDQKTDGVVGLVETVIHGLPDLTEALPPALADALNDERNLAYAANLDVSVRLVDSEKYGRRARRAIVEVENLGDRAVTLMSMQLVGLDKDDDPVMEQPTWAATPIQVDEGDWRGPLLPHSTRRFAVWCYGAEEAVEMTHEITEIRVWNEKSSPELPQLAPQLPEKASEPEDVSV